MSAFSNCNGPEHGGVSLPQVQTLEGLISQLNLLAERVQEIETLMPKAGAWTAGTIYAQIQAVQGSFTTLDNTVTAIKGSAAAGVTLGSLDASYGLLDQAVNALDTAVSTMKGGAADSVTLASLKEALDPIVTAIGAVTNVATAISTAVANNNTALAIAPGDITALKANVAGLITSVAGLLNCVAFEGGYWTFKDYVKTSGIFVYIGTTTSADLDVQAVIADTPTGSSTSVIGSRLKKLVDSYANHMYILGYLDDQALNGALTISESKDRTKTESIDPDTGDKTTVITITKSTTLASAGLNGREKQTGRAHIRFVNSAEMGIIVDMCAVKGAKEDWSDGVGALFCSGAKAFTNDVGVFLCESTDTHGKPQIYLGIAIKATGDYKGNNEFLVAGEQFIPAGVNAIQSLQGVTILAGTELKAKSATATAGAFNVALLTADEIEAETVYAKYFLDEDGDTLITKDTTTDPATVIIGNPKYDLALSSKTRPTIYADNAMHKMAYLGDLVQSIFLQQPIVAAVDQIAADTTGKKSSIAASLQNSIVFIDSNGVVVPPACNPSTGALLLTPADAPTGTTAVGGLYYYVGVRQTTGATPVYQTYSCDGYAFEDGDLALVLDSGTKTQENRPDGRIAVSGKLADGTLLPDGTAIDTKTLSEINVGMIAAGTYLLTQDGYVVKVRGAGTQENAGWYTDGVPVLLAQFKNGFQYSLPMYYKYDSSQAAGSRWVAGDIIQLPQTYDTVMTDYTFEWLGPMNTKATTIGSGAAQQLVVMWRNTDIMWTPHQENSTGMKYSGRCWQFLDMLQLVVHPLPVPVGAMIMWPTTGGTNPYPPVLPAVPEGWLACNGQEVSGTGIYAPLKAVIGTMYGYPETTGNIVLPNIDNTIIRYGINA